MEISTDVMSKLLNAKIKGTFADYSHAKYRSRLFSDAEINFIRESISNSEEHERALLYHHFWLDYSIKEIADKCEMSTKRINEIMNDIIHKLRLKYIYRFSIEKNKNAFFSLEEAPM